MPVIKINIGGTGSDFGLHLPDLPIEVGFSTPALGFGGIPSPGEIDIDDVFTFGIVAKFTCPGYPTCGRIYGPCQAELKKVYNFDLLDLISIKIPGIPSLPMLPSYEFKEWFPSKNWQPLKCPNYNQPPKTT